MSAARTLPETAAKHAAAAGEALVKTHMAEAAAARTRADLITAITAELAAEKKWLTDTYKAMVAFQLASTKSGYSGDRVCLAAFNPWLGSMGFPQPRAETPPDPNANITAYGEDVNLSYLTTKGLRARRDIWHAKWAERRNLIRQSIIDGVDRAHGNFSVEQRNQALEALGLDPIRRVADVTLYVRTHWKLDQTRVSDNAIKEAVVKALTAIIGDGTMPPGRLEDYINVGHSFAEG
jgi:hypothetical protein